MTYNRPLLASATNKTDHHDTAENTVEGGVKHHNSDSLCISAKGPTCLKCDRVQQPSDCTNVVQCGDHEVSHYQCNKTNVNTYTF